MSDSELDAETALLDEVSDLIRNAENFAESKAKAYAREAEENSRKKVQAAEEKTEASILDIRKQLHELSERVAYLERENKTLKANLSEHTTVTKDCNCDCAGLFKCLTDAGQSYLSGRAPEGVDTIGNIVATPLYTGTTSNVDVTCGSSNQLIAYLAEPSQDHSLDATMPIMNSTPVVLEGSGCSTREICSFTALLSPPSATSQIYSDIDNLPEELKAKVLPYNTERSAHCNNDRMTDLQRAYWKYKMEIYKDIDRAG